jgi:general secretion pathway protein G
MNRRDNESGFTLIELLIVVAIIGVLAAIAIPNLMMAMQRSRQKRTMADIRSVAMAWESRHVDMAGYLPAGQNDPVEFGDCAIVPFDTMAAMLAPTYLREVPKHDAWGSEIEYWTNNYAYYIRSAGKDKEFEATPYNTLRTSYYECDIVYGNGTFLVVPDGVQLPGK